MTPRSTRSPVSSGGLCMMLWCAALDRNAWYMKIPYQSRGYALGYALCGTYLCVVVKIQFSSVT